MLQETKIIPLRAKVNFQTIQPEKVERFTDKSVLQFYLQSNPCDSLSLRIYRRIMDYKQTWGEDRKSIEVHKCSETKASLCDEDLHRLISHFRTNQDDKVLPYQIEQYIIFKFILFDAINNLIESESQTAVVFHQDFAIPEFNFMYNALAFIITKIRNQPTKKVDNIKVTCLSIQENGIPMIEIPGELGIQQIVICKSGIGHKVADLNEDDILKLFKKTIKEQIQDFKARTIILAFEVSTSLVKVLPYLVKKLKIISNNALVIVPIIAFNSDQHYAIQNVISCMNQNQKVPESDTDIICVFQDTVMLVIHIQGVYTDKDAIYIVNHESQSIVVVNSDRIFYVEYDRYQQVQHKVPIELFPITKVKHAAYNYDGKELYIFYGFQETCRFEPSIQRIDIKNGKCCKLVPTNQLDQRITHRYQYSVVKGVIMKQNFDQIQFTLVGGILQSFTDTQQYNRLFETIIIQPETNSFTTTIMNKQHIFDMSGKINMGWRESCNPFLIKLIHDEFLYFECHGNYLNSSFVPNIYRFKCFEKGKLNIGRLTLKKYDQADLDTDNQANLYTDLCKKSTSRQVNVQFTKSIAQFDEYHVDLVIQERVFRKVMDVENLSKQDVLLITRYCFTVVYARETFISEIESMQYCIPIQKFAISKECFYLSAIDSQNDMNIFTDNQDLFLCSKRRGQSKAHKFQLCENTTGDNIYQNCYQIYGVDKISRQIIIAKYNFDGEQNKLKIFYCPFAYLHDVVDHEQNTILKIKIEAIEGAEFNVGHPIGISFHDDKINIQTTNANITMNKQRTNIHKIEMKEFLNWNFKQQCYAFSNSKEHGFYYQDLQPNKQALMKGYVRNGGQYQSILNSIQCDSICQKVIINSVKNQHQFSVLECLNQRDSLLRTIQLDDMGNDKSTSSEYKHHLWQVPGNQDVGMFCVFNEQYTIFNL